MEDNTNDTNQLLNFIQTKINDLCQIYIKERQIQGNGILFLTICTNNTNNNTNNTNNTNNNTINREVKIFYKSDETLDSSIRMDIISRREKNTSDIIYFCIFTESGEQNIIELDIRDYVK